MHVLAVPMVMLALLVAKVTISIAATAIATAVAAGRTARRAETDHAMSVMEILGGTR